MLNNIGKEVYILLYIHTDKPEYSDILGVYNNKEKAVKELLEVANYRKINGILTQYMQPTKEYNNSYEELKEKVYKEMELKDVDIYRIEKHIIVS